MKYSSNFMKAYTVQLNAALVVFLMCIACKENDKVQPITEAPYEITDTVVLHLRDQIATYNCYDESAVGYAGIKSDQYRRFEKLDSAATLQDLEVLSDDSNNVVAAYASVLLVNRNARKVYSSFAKALKDSSVVRYTSGCELGENLVYRIIYLHCYYLDRDFNYSELQESAALLKIKENLLPVMDSLYLHSNRTNSYISSLVFDSKRSFDLSTLENRAFEQRDIYALEYLVRYCGLQYSPRVKQILLEELKNEKLGLADCEVIFTVLGNQQDSLTHQALQLKLKKLQEKGFDWWVNRLRSKME